MSYNNSKVPLHMQMPMVNKSLTNIDGPKAQVPKDLIQHNLKYQDMKTPGRQKDSVMRRNLDGSLDFNWAKNMVIDAKRDLHGGSLQPLQYALLKMVYPEIDVPMMGAQANLMTKLSGSEKKKLKSMCEAHMKEETNWNAGRGGGNVHPTRGGTP